MSGRTPAHPPATTGASGPTRRDPPAAGIEEGRPTLLATLGRLTHAQVTGFARTPIAAFFTIIFPLIFLCLLSVLIGNEVVESRSGIRLAQFLTPAIGAYAAATAAYTSLAIGLAIDRENGVLRRHRVLPVHAGVLLGSRVAAGVVTGSLAVLLMVAVGVAAFDVQVVWEKAPAAVLTVVLGIGCFAALGFAVSSVAPTAAATQAITNATLVPLAFISDVFVVGAELPRPLEVLAGIFPLKAFANALGQSFNPFTPGAGFAWSHLALMLVWLIAGVAIAQARFTWETAQPMTRSSVVPTAVTRTVTGAQSPRSGPAAPPGARGPDRGISDVAAPTGLARGEDIGQPRTSRLLATQVRAGVLTVIRTPSSAFFTLAFPTIMLLLFTQVFGNGPIDSKGGVVLAQHLAPALAVFGMATVCYAEFAERLAGQRERGVLKRMRGTPLPFGVLIAGRIGASVIIGLTTMAVALIVGVAFLGVEVQTSRLPLFVLIAVVALGTFTLLGLALVSIAPTAEAVSPLANGTLLPLGFASDVFLIGDLPTWLQTIGDALPLRPAVVAASDALNPTLGQTVPWARLGVLVAWGAVGLLIIRLRPPWEQPGR